MMIIIIASIAIKTDLTHFQHQHVLMCRFFLRPAVSLRLKARQSIACSFKKCGWTGYPVHPSQPLLIAELGKKIGASSDALLLLCSD